MSHGNTIFVRDCYFTTAVYYSIEHDRIEHRIELSSKSMDLVKSVALVEPMSPELAIAALRNLADSLERELSKHKEEKT